MTIEKGSLRDGLPHFLNLLNASNPLDDFSFFLDGNI